MAFEFLGSATNRSPATLTWRAEPATGSRRLFVAGCVVAILVHVYAIALLTFVLDVSVSEEFVDTSLVNDEIGNDPDLPTNYNIDRVEEVGIPSPGMQTGSVGAVRVKMLLREGGGNSRSETAVVTGLRWLAAQQDDDGSWARTTSTSGTQTVVTGDVLATGLAVLPFLAAGETHQSKPRTTRFSHTVARALNFLTSNQDDNGRFAVDRTAHALATLALCEAYGMTSDPALKAPAQRALDAAVAAQHCSGGWGAQGDADADTLTTGWFVQALKSGQMAGFDVPNATWVSVNQYLDSVSTDGATYGFQSPEPTPLTTAVGLQCRQYLGWGQRHPGLEKGVADLAKQLPSVTVRDSCYQLHATRVLYNMAPCNLAAWERWNPAMRDLLNNSQDRDPGPNMGSWAPDGDAWGDQVGRLGVTALSLLTLETYYGRLPLCRREISALKDDTVGEPVE